MDIKRIGRFIKRIIKWIPLIWEQDDCNYSHLYTLIEIKLRELKEGLIKDELHVGNERHIRNISICLAHLDRFRHWEKYIEFPDFDLEFEPTEDGRFYRMVHNKALDRACKRANSFEQENYERFWNLFLKQHRHWWC